MDSFTQIVLGAAVGEAILGKKVGNKAIFWGAVGGTIPDLDVLASPFLTDMDALALHRGISHSLLFGLVFPFLVAWLPTLIHKKSNLLDRVGYKDWVLLFIGSIITHPILDAFTAYGTQLFLPFTDYRVAFNSISIIDPLYTIPFVMCLFLASRYHRSGTKRRHWNWLGLGWSSLYLLFTVGMHQYIHKVVDHTLAIENIEYTRYNISPTLFNSALWNVTIESGDHFTLGLYSVFDKKKTLSDRIKINKNYNLIDKYHDSKSIKILKWFTNEYYAIRKSSHKLELNDLRYGRINPEEDHPKFVFNFILNPNNQGDIDAKEIRTRPDDPSGLLWQIWTRVKGK